MDSVSCNVWEEAENEFYQEAFIPLHQSSHDSTLKTIHESSLDRGKTSNTSLEPGFESDQPRPREQPPHVQRLLQHPPPRRRARQSSGGSCSSSNRRSAASALLSSSSSSNLAATRGVKGGSTAANEKDLDLQQRQPIRKSTRSRMRAEVQGLENDDSEVVVDDEEELPMSGNELFFNENVMTPLEVWKNTLHLKSSCIFLKYKRRIKRDYQKRPVLKVSGRKALSWHVQKLVFRLKTFCRNFSECRRQPYTRHTLEQHKGKGVQDMIAIYERKACLSLIFILIVHLPSLLSCCNLCDWVQDTPESLMLNRRNATPEEQALSRNNDISQFLIQGTLLLRERILFVPFGHRIPVANVFTYSVCWLVVCLVYAAIFFSALRTKQFEYNDNASSVFRNVFATYQMATMSEKLTYHRQERRYLAMKVMMRREWKVWSRMAIAVEIIGNLVLVFTGFIYPMKLINQHEGQFHRRLMQELPNPKPIYYYAIWTFYYFCCRYLLPDFLNWITYTLRCPFGRTGSGLDVQRRRRGLPQDDDVHMGGTGRCQSFIFTGRAFLLPIFHHLLLLFALLNDFSSSSQWLDILTAHLSLCAVVDVAVLLCKLIYQLFVSMACACACSCAGGDAPLSSLSLNPTSNWSLCQLTWADLTAPKAIGAVACDWFVLTIAIAWSPILILPLVIKQLTRLLILHLSARLTYIPEADGRSENTVKLIESTFSLSSLALAAVVHLSVASSWSHLKQCSVDIYRRYVKGNVLLEHATIIISYEMDNLPPFTAFVKGIVFFLFCMLMLKHYLHKSSLERECTFLKNQLQEVNQDKKYQIVKQKQWHPCCKCYENQKTQLGESK